jgi:hypothetical protein
MPIRLALGRPTVSDPNRNYRHLAVAEPDPLS